MAKLQSLDPNTEHTDVRAVQGEDGRIVRANTFVVPKERTESFPALFRRQAEFMKAQPGFVSLRMHKGTADSRLLLNVAVWESTEGALATALGSPEFQYMAAESPDDIVSYPHIFERIDACHGSCDRGGRPEKPCRSPGGHASAPCRVAKTADRPATRSPIPDQGVSMAVELNHTIVPARSSRTTTRSCSASRSSTPPSPASSTAESPTTAIPHCQEAGQIYHSNRTERRRGTYFHDPDGHLMEILTPGGAAS